MREIRGDIWDFHKQGHWIVITTNGNVKANGACVMGRGIALQARLRFPYLPFMLGSCIKVHGSRVHTFLGLRLIAFPTKHHWKEPADLKLIETSAEELVSFVNRESIGKVYLVRPGCTNGQLDWRDVKPVLERYLDDRFVVVER